MLFKNITIMDENFRIKENMYVGVKASKIAYIGENIPKEDFGEVYEGKDRLLMSGFYNAHSHSPMSLMRGYGENLNLQDWLNQKIFPFEEHLDSNAVYWGTLLDLAEATRFGVVSTSDMYYFCPDMAKAYMDMGAKGNISRSIAAFSDEPLFETTRGRECIEFYESWNGAGEGRIIADMSLHAEYTSVPSAVKELAEYTKEIGANMQVHVSETRAEHEECIIRHGKTPAAYLADLGLFDTSATAAHCVWATSEDMDIFKEKNVTVATNAVSNLKLASGVCNVPELMKRGINVAIGTDSVASNNNHNILGELKSFAITQKMYWKDPTLITPKEAFYAATRAGALAQGRKDCGLLKVGNRADIIAIDLSWPNLYPVHDLTNNLLFSSCGGEICMTMVDGKVLYKDGEFTTIDIEKVKFEADKVRKKILSAL